MRLGGGNGSRAPRRAAAADVRVGILAVLALCLLGPTGCGLDSPSLDVPPQTGATGALTPPPASGVPNNYTGLGSHLPAFSRGHREAPSSPGAARTRKGQVATRVKADAAGRVTGYVTSFNYQPPVSDAQRLASAVGLEDLPADRITVKAAATCLIYASPTMKRLVGMLYTRVQTTRGSTTAEVRATPTPNC